MICQNWMSWEGGVDVVAMTTAGLAMPNVIIHVARVVHTPAGSAPGGMVLWQPDPAGPPLAFGFVSPCPAVGGYFGKHIFAGTPFEDAPVLEGSISTLIDGSAASARLEIPGFVFEMRLSDLAAALIIDRQPASAAPFHQQGIEAAATRAALQVNGTEIPLIVPAAGITGGPAAVAAPCGIYAR